jgi:hypothetical protein
VLLEGEESTPYGEALPDRTGGPPPDSRESSTSARFWNPHAGRIETVFGGEMLRWMTGLVLCVDIARQFVQPIRRDAVRVDADRVWGRSARCTRQLHLLLSHLSPHG